MTSVTEFDSLSVPSAWDLFHIIDADDSNEDKKITLRSFVENIPSDVSIKKVDGYDLVYGLYSGGTLVGRLWYDDSHDNIVVENEVSGGTIVLNTNGGEIHVYDNDAGETVAKIDVKGSVIQAAQSSDPSYQDGYAILYPYVSGSTRELRMRLKDGATEVQFEFPDKDSISGSEWIVVRDKKAQNTDGGDFTSGAWRTRVINEELVDTGSHCSISSNQITLDAGTYRCRIVCPAYKVGRHQAILYDTTNSATLLTGTSAYSQNGDYAVTNSVIVGQFTLASQATLEIRHRCSVTKTGNGFGIACNFTDEIYTVAEFEKIS